MSKNKKISTSVLQGGKDRKLPVWNYIFSKENIIYRLTICSFPSCPDSHCRTNPKRHCCKCFSLHILWTVEMESPQTTICILHPPHQMPRYRYVLSSWDAVSSAKQSLFPEPPSVSATCFHCITSYFFAEIMIIRWCSYTTSKLHLKYPDSRISYSENIYIY